MALFWWFVAIVLMAIGLIGMVVPMIPGAIVILAAALLHRLMLGPALGVSWWTIGIMTLLTALSYLIELAAGYFGARRFGATKWGTFGAILGALVGIFFGIFGLLLGPIVGAIAGELIAGKKMIEAGRAGWGTLLGNLGGMLAKLILGLVMVAIFLTTAPSPF